MREHTFARKTIRVINRIITWIEVVVFAILLIFGLYAIWDNQRIDNENTASEYEMYKPTAKDTRTYEDFQKLNPDVCGWLTIDNTGIDYPLVQGGDNDEYMNTTPDLQFALSGSLFLDYQNSRDFSDFNTIIYGHHMEGPSMFGALDQYSDESFFEGHEKGELYYDENWHALDIFAYLEVDAYDQQIYSHPSDTAGYQEYLDYIREHAAHYKDAGASASDHIIVMSTCMTDKTNGRYIVIAKIGEIVPGPKTADNGGGAAREGLSLQELNRIFALIGAAIIFLIILLYLLYRRKKRKRDRERERRQALGKAREQDLRIAKARDMERGIYSGEQIAMQERAAGTARAENRSSSAGPENSGAGDGIKGSGRGNGTGGRKGQMGRNEKAGKTKAESDGSRNTKKKKASVGDDLINLIIRIGIIVAAVWVVFHYVFGIYVNSGIGMEPSVQDRDIILFYRMDNEYTANEAVVYEAGGAERLGRIVARGGDTVEITDEGLKVNGYLQQDYKNEGETLAVKGGTEYPVTLAEDEVFILGDNREESTDSRMFGPVKLDHIKGSVMTVLRRRDV